MRAEFLKLGSMPTPRWTAVILALFFLGGLAASVIWGAGEENVVLETAIGLPLMVSSLVIGAWIVGVEFGQHTLRRVLSADPRRTRLVMVKLAVLLIVISAATLLLFALGTGLYALAASGHETGIEFDLVPRVVAATLLTNVVWGVAAMSLTLLTRSMAGGITLVFAFIFLIDGLLSIIPEVGDFTFGVVLNDVDLAIRGDDVGLFQTTQVHDTALSALVLAGWVIVFVVAGVIRTQRSEVK